MPRAKSSSKAEDVNPDYVRMYYEHQIDRIKINEGHALNISNIVLTISALIITFGISNKQSISSVLILFLPVVIIFANIFAISYVMDSGRWIKTHRMRAKRILEIFQPELYSLDKETFAPHKKKRISLRKTQVFVHLLFILITVILLLLFAVEMLGVSIT